MTPGARAAAAIEVLDQWNSGTALERALTQWARSNRYAGSSDRAAIRDLCYDVARRKRSCEWLGGGKTGRALVIGLLRAQGQDLGDIFSGQGYAPHPLDEYERPLTSLDKAPEPIRHDCPDWLWEHYQLYQPRRAEMLDLMKSRAPVYLRVNHLLATRSLAVSVLAEDEIAAEPHDLAQSALVVTKNERRIQQSKAFKSGLVELQDAASQAVVESMQIKTGQSVLDFCAGGGGKTLAIAALTGQAVYAHDANAARMKDLPNRADRAGAIITIVEELSDLKTQCDVVVCDVPCSGSGSWRRDPESKWALTSAQLSDLNTVQSEILHRAKQFVRPGGCLAYATCSVFEVENEKIVQDFTGAHSSATLEHTHQFLPFDGGDGFFVARLRF